MRIELYLARRYLFRGKARHISFIGIISCLGVILGVATVIVALSIINGVDGGLMERIMQFRDHLVVESLNPQEIDKVKEVIQKWDEVEFAAVTLQTQVFAKLDSTILPVVVKGVDFNDEGGRKSFNQYIKEEVGSYGVFVGKGLKDKFSLQDTFEFYPLKKRLVLEEEKIRGVFSVGLYDVDNYYIIADLERAKALSPNYLLFLGVKLKEPFNADKVKERIKKTFPQGVFVNTWIETNSALFTTLKLERMAMLIILTLIIIIASFNIFATLTIKVVEKIKDIGVLKSLGFTNKKILMVFTFQGIILGAVGVICGTALGLIICYILKTYPIIRLPEEIFFTEYLPVTVRWADVINIAVISMIIAFVSSLIPALRASRLAVCEALRYE